MNKLEKYLSSCMTYPHWKKIGIYHHHGFCIPLFSLRSKKSCGIGEFLDILPIIDWCQELGMDIIQLLPLNETGPAFSPYNALSSCALEPMLLSLHALPHLEKKIELKKKLHLFSSLNSKKYIDYLYVKKKKLSWLYEYYLSFFDFFRKDEHFLTFCRQNHWLENYALFHSIKDDLQEDQWQKWPKDLQDLSEKNFSFLLKKHEKKINFYFLLQYLSFYQMESVKEYAQKKKVFLKGDIPILISPSSCDVWSDRKIFDMSHIAGCPPDDYEPKGQKWGFPLFNWDLLKKRGFDWWKRRLNVASSCYHIYRIDHVVGFFRIWAILPSDLPIHGKFLPKDPKKWSIQGKENLEMMINNSSLLPIAEDLGLIPHCVYSTLNELGICGTKVMRWQKNNSNFIALKDYEPLSMTCVSNHDLEPMRLLWQACPEEAKKLAQEKNWRYQVPLSEEKLKEILYDSHHTSSLFHINLLQEYLSLFPSLRWDNPKDDRINRPGTIDKRNWTYRFRPYVEKIISHNGLKQAIKDIIKKI